jgi:hypothetical protein
MLNPIAITMEDPIIHTDDYPFCSDCSCPCHDIQDGQYYRFICRPLLDGLMTAEEANRLYFGDNPLDTRSCMRADFRAASASYEQASEQRPTDDETDGQWVNGDEEDDETGTHAPGCRCSWCEPQEGLATQQCSDGSWW